MVLAVRSGIVTGEWTLTRVVVVVLVGLLAFAAILLMLGWWGLWLYDHGLPWSRLRPYGTSWAVVAVDGVLFAAGENTFTFGIGIGVDEATLRTGCGTIRLDIVTDTDSDWIEFELPNDPLSCSGAAASDQSRLIEAFGGVERWTVQTDDAITMHGTHEIRLVRAVGR